MRKKQQKQNASHRIAITVQQSLIRLAYNLTVSYLNEHSRASAGGALTDYFRRLPPAAALTIGRAKGIIARYETVRVVVYTDYARRVFYRRDESAGQLDA